NDKGELDGYSLRVVNLVKDQLEKDLGKPIAVQVVETGDIMDRIPKLLTREIDISCDTAFTWTRNKYVDFSVSYSVTGIRLLVPKGSTLNAPESLIGKRIAIVPKTVSEKAIKLAQPKAELVSFKSLEEAVNALKEGKVDGVAGDSILLDGLRQKIGLADAQLVPKTPYASYGVGCMVRQYDPTFLRAVNYTIVGFMEGYLAGDKGPTEMVNSWIGPDGVVKIDPQVVRDFFNFTLITHEQIPPAQ
ncbi:MAG: extracellular substrate binding-like orphan protein GrrP, partial [Microcystaceae cyanobacterium]